MTKSDIIDRVSKDTAVEKKKVENVIEAFIETVMATLKNGEDVRLAYFGNFKVNERKERKARNPKTGETVIVAAKKAVHFKPSKTFNDVVNE